MTEDRQDDAESGSSLRLPGPPPGDDVPASPGGAPSFFPADDQGGTRADLDALLPSMRPDGAQADERAPGTTADDISQVVAMLDPTGTREGSGELVIPGFEPEPLRPSQRPGLLSTMLTHDRPEADEGAATALRNVARRVRGRARAPWPAAGPDCDLARTALLAHLADRTSGSLRARLACATAEMEARQGDTERAAVLYGHAHAADPSDVVALRALQKIALANGTPSRLADLLHEESHLSMSSEERASVWTHLVAVEIARGDAGAAERAATEASTHSPSACVPRLLLACFYARHGRTHEAGLALRQVADAWPDPRGRAGLRIEAARLFARAGEAHAAIELADRALADDPHALDALACAYRVRRAENDTEAALRTVERMLRIVDDPQWQAELTRTSARLAQDVAGDSARALALLHGAGGLAALRQRARAAEALGDIAARAEALAAWAESTGGTERAIALLELASVHAARGDAANAEQSLDEAARADAAFGLVRIARETLARRSGDPERLARAFGGQAAVEALEAAARIAATPGEELRERGLLEAARGAGAGPTADAVGVDAAAGANAWNDVVTGLERATAALHGPARAGALLALADLARRARVDGVDPRALVVRACAEAPYAPHALARRAFAATSDGERAESWLARARAWTGSAAAAAAMLAHAYARRASIDGAPALERALEASPRFLPALWSRERAGYAAGDAEAIHQSLRLVADRSVDPIERATRRVRLALAQPAEARDEARRLLDEAALERPADASISALALELAETDAVAHAEHLDRAAAGAEPALARALQVEAATRYEDADDAGRAAALYLGALDTSGGTDPHARLGLARTLPRTGLGALVSQRLDAELHAASDDDARALCLERIAQHHGAVGRTEKAVDEWRALLALHPGHRGAMRALERHALETDDQPALLAGTRDALALFSGRADRRAYLALAWHLMRDASAEARDALLTDADLRDPDPWLALRGEAAGRRAGNAPRVARATLAIATHLPDARERAAYTLRAAEAIEEHAPADAARWLREVVDTPHPIVGEELGHLVQDDDPAGAATAYTAAARASVGTERRVRLWHRAACLWQDRAADAARALEALRETLALDPTHADAFARARRLLEAARDDVGLALLFEERLLHPMEPDAALALETERAALSAHTGDRARARAALEHALTLAPDRLDLLERLAELRIQAGEHREAAELLVRLARMTQDSELLRRTFFTLGTLYDEHVPDARRAEIAFTRVAALAPDDPVALERLAGVLSRKGDFQKALRVLTHLYDIARNDEAVGGRCAIRIAETLDALGEPVEAERMLENHRRSHPANALVIDALADLYTRQNAPGPLAIHLDRTALSLREVIEREPAAPEPWRLLAEVLTRRGRGDDARTVAGLANALGVGGGSPARRAGLGAKALQPATLRSIVPPGLDAAARSLLRALESVADAALPSAPKVVGAAPIEAPTPALAEALSLTETWLGARPRVHATEGSRCFPIVREPLTIAIGRELVEHASGNELAFLLVRAAVLARLDLTVVARTDPAEMTRGLRSLANLLEGVFDLDEFEAALTGEFARPPAPETEVLSIVDTSETTAGALREVMDSIAPPEPVPPPEPARTVDDTPTSEAGPPSQDAPSPEVPPSPEAAPPANEPSPVDDDEPRLIVEEEPLADAADAPATATNDTADVASAADAGATMGTGEQAPTSETKTGEFFAGSAELPAEAEAPTTDEVDLEADIPTIPPKPPSARATSSSGRASTPGAAFAASLGPAERAALLACVRELRAAGIDPASVGSLALEAGSRVGLVVTGDCASALTALFATADPSGTSGDPLVAVERVPEARALLAFALSDAHLALVHAGDGSR
jgi:hypothetical protein